MRSNINNDSTEFIHLLSEILAAGVPDETMHELCDSMDLERHEILAILIKADQQFKTVKEEPNLPQPGFYRVEVNRIASASKTILIEFNGVGSLEELAMIAGCDHDFGLDDTSEYEVESWTRISDLVTDRPAGVISSCSRYKGDYNNWIEIQV